MRSNGRINRNLSSPMKRSTLVLWTQAIAACAAEQHGVVTWDQALARGLTPSMLRRRLESGAWERLFRGVYRVGGSPDTWRQRLLAATFAAGKDAVASHRVAAAIHRLPGGRTGAEITIPKAGGSTRKGSLSMKVAICPQWMSRCKRALR